MNKRIRETCCQQLNCIAELEVCPQFDSIPNKWDKALEIYSRLEKI